MLQSIYFDYGFRYYVAGRLAASERIHPVAANLLHHSIAMFLLSGICNCTTEGERGGLGRDLKRIWNIFKDRLSDPIILSRFDETVNALHEFEKIAQPEAMTREVKSELVLDEIEALMKAICVTSGINKTRSASSVGNGNNDKYPTEKA